MRGLKLSRVLSRAAAVGRRNRSRAMAAAAEGREKSAMPANASVAAPPAPSMAEAPLNLLVGSAATLGSGDTTRAMAANPHVAAPASSAATIASGSGSAGSGSGSAGSGSAGSGSGSSGSGSAGSKRGGKKMCKKAAKKAHQAKLQADFDARKSAEGGRPPLNCPYCTLEFHTAESLQRHILHTHAKGAQAQCGGCFRTFNSRAALRQHKPEGVCPEGQQLRDYDEYMLHHTDNYLPRDRTKDIGIDKKGKIFGLK